MINRVRVYGGDGAKDLGAGTLEGFVTVYANFDKKSGALMSMKDATIKPEPMDGCVLREIRDNPKIKLDSGDIVYGCQVWWQPIEESK